MWHGSIRSIEIAELAAHYGDGYFHNNIFWPASHTGRMIRHYRERFEHYGHGPADQAIVGLGGQFYVREKSQDALREFRPYFDRSPVYGGGPSLEETIRQTPLSVGSPQQVIDQILGFRKYAGDYQRQLFNVDGMGIPHASILEQIEKLDEIVQVLRKEFAVGRPAHIPDAPTHESLKAAEEQKAAG